MRSAGTRISLALVTGMLALLCAAPAQAAWRALSDEAFNDYQVCRDGIYFGFAAGPLVSPPEQPGPPGSQVPLLIHPIAASPPFLPGQDRDEQGNELPFPPETIVMRADLTVPYDPHAGIFGPDVFHSYFGNFTVPWLLPLAPGTLLQFDFFPGQDSDTRPGGLEDPSDDIVVQDCLVFHVPPPPPPAVKDTVKPVSTLGGPSTQDIDKLYVTGQMNEAGQLSATGTVNVPSAAKLHRFKSISKAAQPNVRVKLKLKLSKKSRRAAKRAMRRGKRLRAKITVKATDKAGNVTTTKRSIRLKP